ncbi:MAG: hypothetical protein A2X49_13505 [Lentisphaerae bacterium GWF2_52_8]|nr:MAG: hypothetical protein A2X49_13505 [Lentisphaerae bacterium GWF2_52_8]
MSIIRILPEQVSNRIAAGEVIERPASVIKELMENSLDAGAGSISISVESAGLRLISVTDDGKGMDPDDALLSLEPHATSKIATENDINGIRSFGFRGEALPSIASVSRLTLRTRTPDTLEGTEIFVQGGKFIKSSPVGCSPGTEILVRELFFNTPARKKFLRSPQTEEKHIEETILSLSLPHPGVAVELILDGRRVFSSPAHRDLLPRLNQFFGCESASQFLPVAYEAYGVSVSGFTARHGITRSSRREQRVFINARPVDAAPVFRGIKEAYGSLVPQGRFPPVILFLQMDPMLVDVNVHPAKREVRFRKESIVISAVSEALRCALRSSPNPTFSVDAQVPLRSMLEGASVSYRPAEGKTAPSLPFTPHQIPAAPAFPSRPSMPGTFRLIAEKPLSTPMKEKILPFPADNFPGSLEEASQKEEAPLQSPGSEIALPGGQEMKIVGFLGETYILAISASGLIVIDQHAAHERVLYEKLLHASDEKSHSQPLLFPMTVELSRPELLLVEKSSEAFASLGFDLEPFGNNTVLVHSIPAPLRQDNAGGLIHDILSSLSEDEELARRPDKVGIAKAACKAAVKAHDLIGLAEAQALVSQMAACELPFSCPHGRPTILNISLSELAKRFGRS